MNRRDADNTCEVPIGNLSGAVKLIHSNMNKQFLDLLKATEIILVYEASSRRNIELKTKKILFLARMADVAVTANSCVLFIVFVDAECRKILTPWIVSRVCSIFAIASMQFAKKHI